MSRGWRSDALPVLEHLAELARAAGDLGALARIGELLEGVPEIAAPLENPRPSASCEADPELLEELAEDRLFSALEGECGCEE